MRNRVDRVLAGLTGVVCLGSLAVTWQIALPSYSSLRYVPRDPLGQEWEALWAGLLAADLMLLQTLFAARVPWLERAWGRGRLMRLHRWAGWWSFWLMLVHVGLFALQRALRHRDHVLAEWRYLFLQERHLLIATIGTVLLTLVVVTSVAAARRWLRYESWHLVHVWSYLGMGLVLPHMLTATDLMRGWHHAYWWAAYLVVLAAVLGFRVVLPLARSLRHRLRVVAVTPETDGLSSIVVGGTGLDRTGARPGQFLTWRFLGARGRLAGHPYSLSDAPTDTRLRITVDTRGDGGARAASAPVGSRVLVEGPYGELGSLRRRHPRLLLLAAGVGVTPFRSLLAGLPLAPGEATLVHRVHAAGLFQEELAALAATRGFEVVVLAGPRRAAYSWLPAGRDGTESGELLALVPDLLDCDVVLCGPPAWSAAVRRALGLAGMRRRDIHEESFRW